MDAFGLIGKDDVVAPNMGHSGPIGYMTYRHTNGNTHLKTTKNKVFSLDSLHSTQALFSCAMICSDSRINLEIFSRDAFSTWLSFFHQFSRLVMDCTALVYRSTYAKKYASMSKMLNI